MPTAIIAYGDYCLRRDYCLGNRYLPGIIACWVFIAYLGVIEVLIAYQEVIIANRR